MTCRELAPLLDELIDGALDDDRARAVRAHLRSCAACAERHEATQQLVRAAGSLEPVDPPATLWAGIAERMDREDAPLVARPRWWWWWRANRRVVVPAGALAAVAGVALVVSLARRAGDDAGGGGATRPAPSAPVAPGAAPGEAAPGGPAPIEALAAVFEELDRAEQDYARAIGELRGVVRVERARWRPEVASAFDDNLAAIDAAVERQRLATRRDPADVTAVDALHASYRKEIDFLQEAVVRGGVP